MKKTAIFIGIMVIMAIICCKKKEELPIPPATPIATETAAPPSAPIPDKEKDGTSIKVDSDGLNISTKDSKNKTDINVSDGDASVEIKK